MYEPRKYPLSPRLKNTLLDSAKRLGCRLSDFNVIAFSNAGSLVDLAWDLDDNLRVSLKFQNNKTYLEQTFKGKPQTVPVRWGKELPPALQFSDHGICQLTYGNCWRFVQQLNLFKQLGTLLPFLPLHLSQLFKNTQDKLQVLFETGWQLQEAVVAVRSSKIKMARQLNFGEHTVDLIIRLSEKGSQEIGVLLQVCSIDKQAHIPEYLKLSVFDSYGKTDEEKAPGNKPGIEQRGTFNVGDKFSVTVELDGVTVTENFVI